MELQEQILGTKCMDTNTTQPKVDPTALALSRSIRAAEGGDYNNTSGDNNTSAGAYQFNNGKIPLKKGEIPANFKSWAAEQGLDPNDFSQTNQDHVAYNRIKQKLDAGQAPSSIAAEWNSGLSTGWENHVGDVTINGKTIHYDTPAYVEKVKKEYQNQLNGGGTSDNSTPSSVQDNDLTKDTIINSSSPDITPDQHSGTLGTNPSDSLYGKLIDNSVTRGIINVGNALSFGGAKQLGDQVGNSLATIKEKTSGLLGKQDNSKYIPENSFGKTVAGTGKIIGSTLALAGSGLIGDLFKGKSALQAPEVVNALENTLGKGETIANLTRQNAIDALGNTLKEMPTTEVGGKTEQLILKALKELNPTLQESKSLVNKLLKGGWDLAKGYALYNLLGDKIGGFIHQNTK